MGYRTASGSERDKDSRFSCAFIPLATARGSVMNLLSRNPNHVIVLRSLSQHQHLTVNKI